MLIYTEKRGEFSKTNDSRLLIVGDESKNDVGQDQKVHTNNIDYREHYYSSPLFGAKDIKEVNLVMDGNNLYLDSSRSRICASKISDSTDCSELDYKNLNLQDSGTTKDTEDSYESPSIASDEITEEIENLNIDSDMILDSVNLSSKESFVQSIFTKDDEDREVQDEVCSEHTRDAYIYDDCGKDTNIENIDVGNGHDKEDVETTFTDVSRKENCLEPKNEFEIYKEKTLPCVIDSAVLDYNNTDERVITNEYLSSARLFESVKPLFSVSSIQNCGSSKLTDNEDILSISIEDKGFNPSKEISIDHKKKGESPEGDNKSQEQIVFLEKEVIDEIQCNTVDNTALSELDDRIAFMMFQEKLKSDIVLSKNLLKIMKRHLKDIKSLRYSSRRSFIFRKSSKVGNFSINMFKYNETNTFIKAYNMFLTNYYDIQARNAETVNQYEQIINNFQSICKVCEISLNSCTIAITKLKKSINNIQIVYNRNSAKLQNLINELNLLNEIDAKKLNGEVKRSSIQGSHYNRQSHIVDGNFNHKKRINSRRHVLKNRIDVMTNICNKERASLNALNSVLYVSKLPFAVLAIKDINDDLIKSRNQCFRAFITNWGDFLNFTHSKLICNKEEPTTSLVDQIDKINNDLDYQNFFSSLSNVLPFGYFSCPNNPFNNELYKSFGQKLIFPKVGSVDDTVILRCVKICINNIENDKAFNNAYCKNNMFINISAALMLKNKIIKSETFNSDSFQIHFYVFCLKSFIYDLSYPVIPDSMIGSILKFAYSSDKEENLEDNFAAKILSIVRCSLDTLYYDILVTIIRHLKRVIDRDGDNTDLADLISMFVPILFKTKENQLDNSLPIFRWIKSNLFQMRNFSYRDMSSVLTLLVKNCNVLFEPRGKSQNPENV